METNQKRKAEPKAKAPKRKLGRDEEEEVGVPKKRKKAIEETNVYEDFFGNFKNYWANGEYVGGGGIDADDSDGDVRSEPMELDSEVEGEEGGDDGQEADKMRGSAKKREKVPDERAGLLGPVLRAGISQHHLRRQLPEASENGQNREAVNEEKRRKCKNACLHHKLQDEEEMRKKEQEAENLKVAAAAAKKKRDEAPKKKKEEVVGLNKTQADTQRLERQKMMKEAEEKRVAELQKTKKDVDEKRKKELEAIASKKEKPKTVNNKKVVPDPANSIDKKQEATTLDLENRTGVKLMTMTKKKEKEVGQDDKETRADKAMVAKKTVEGSLETPDETVTKLAKKAEKTQESKETCAKNGEKLDDEKKGKEEVGKKAGDVMDKKTDADVKKKNVTETTEQLRPTMAPQTLGVEQARGDDPANKSIVGEEPKETDLQLQNQLHPPTASKKTTPQVARVGDSLPATEAVPSAKPPPPPAPTEQTDVPSTAIALIGPELSEAARRITDFAGRNPQNMENVARTLILAKDMIEFFSTALCVNTETNSTKNLSEKSSVVDVPAEQQAEKIPEVTVVENAARKLTEKPPVVLFTLFNIPCSPTNPKAVNRVASQIFEENDIVCDFERICIVEGPIPMPFVSRPSAATAVSRKSVPPKCFATIGVPSEVGEQLTKVIEKRDASEDASFESETVSAHSAMDYEKVLERSLLIIGIRFVRRTVASALPSSVKVKGKGICYTPKAAGLPCWLQIEKLLEDAEFRDYSRHLLNKSARTYLNWH